MKIICVTGKSGSGKSTIAKLISEKLQGKYVNIDEIGHQALFEPYILEKLSEKFGKHIINFEGNIDRKKLGNIVFSNKTKMEQLTQITWSYMEKEIDKIIEQNTVVVLDWVLLPVTKYWNNCEKKILIEAEILKRKNIVMERDKIGEEYFNKRDLSAPDYSKIDVDEIYYNDYSIENVGKFVELIKNEIDKT